MARLLTIGALARSAGVKASTVRYYERFGLLEPDSRTEGNYRVYGRTALERLWFIRAAQASGFTLEDVKLLLGFRDGTTPPCTEVQKLLEERIADVQIRLSELRRVQSALRTSLRRCRQTEVSGRCQVLDRLKQASSARASGVGSGAGTPG